MMTHPTYEQQARDWHLWREYVDLDAVMTIEEFEAMTVDERIELIIEAFGPEPNQPPTVQEVLDGLPWRGWNGSSRLLGWGVEGGEIQISEDDLRPALEAAYDPHMPDWPSTVGDPTA
jgi:hypothetical protein